MSIAVLGDVPGSSARVDLLWPLTNGSHHLTSLSPALSWSLSSPCTPLPPSPVCRLRGGGGGTWVPFPFHAFTRDIQSTVQSSCSQALTAGLKMRVAEWEKTENPAVSTGHLLHSPASTGTAMRYCNSSETFWSQNSSCTLLKITKDPKSFYLLFKNQRALLYYM